MLMTATGLTLFWNPANHPSIMGICSTPPALTPLVIAVLVLLFVSFRLQCGKRRAIVRSSR